tara:strand:+ start:378 stop:491 length:114 start_codon:yes stop_codon:yes gene_type:complete
MELGTIILGVGIGIIVGNLGTALIKKIIGFACTKKEG